MHEGVIVLVHLRQGLLHNMLYEVTNHLRTSEHGDLGHGAYLTMLLAVWVVKVLQPFHTLHPGFILCLQSCCLHASHTQNLLSYN